MFKRFRNRRVDEATRQKHREIFLQVSDFIWPVFIVSGNNIKTELEAMPGVFHYSVDRLLMDLAEYIQQGLNSILVFGVPENKGIEQAYASDGLVQTSVRVIKKAFPKLEVITDVCLCSYTKNGHCHIGDNDKTCEVLAKIAVSHAQAGADIVAPSDMMDGRVYYIKKALQENKLGKVKILAYSAKYASRFYGPFREAADCTPADGDRRTYQMDFCNSREAMEEIAADLEEGADQIMIKPAMTYLDIVAKAKNNFKFPIVAYNVSGEYVMIKNSIDTALNPPDIIFEILISIKRAGADRIVSYFVPDLLEKLNAQ